MAVEAAKTDEHITLPFSAVTRADIGRLLRETESVDNFLRQASIRQSGTAVKLPRTSRLYDEIVASNKLNMLQEEDRRKLYGVLQKIYKEAPILHMSFGTDPSPVFLQRLVAWIRQNIHPQALLQIGLVPNIGAGCVVRTNNKFFNFSLRQRFTEARPMLISKLQGAAVVSYIGEVTVPAEVIKKLTGDMPHELRQPAF
jgi:hypothetical protein